VAKILKDLPSELGLYRKLKVKSLGHCDRLQLDTEDRAKCYWQAVPPKRKTNSKPQI
jgi:hypothetical protein